MIFSVGDLITFALLPNTNLYGMFAIPVGRIYTNVCIVLIKAVHPLTIIFEFEDSHGYPSYPREDQDRPDYE